MAQLAQSPGKLRGVMGMATESCHFQARGTPSTLHHEKLIHDVRAGRNGLDYAHYTISECHLHSLISNQINSSLPLRSMHIAQVALAISVVPTNTMQDKDEAEMYPKKVILQQVLH